MTEPGQDRCWSGASPYAACDHPAVSWEQADADAGQACDSQQASRSSWPGRLRAADPLACSCSLHSRRRGAPDELPLLVAVPVPTTGVVGSAPLVLLSSLYHCTRGTNQHGLPAWGRGSLGRQLLRCPSLP